MDGQEAGAVVVPVYWGAEDGPYMVGIWQGPHVGTHFPSNRQTHMTENITFPQLRWRAANIQQGR